MLQSMRHESFYETGTWIDETLGIYVGWTVRKGSWAARMPICNENNDAVLIFAGEDYSDPEVFQRLRDKGHIFDHSGPSYLIHCYEEEPSFPAALNGRFQGLLADKARGIAMIFNDRYGLHRLYFHESKEAFYFAAEAKAILAARPQLRRASPRGLGELVTCGCVLENRTLFQDVHVLPPASAWVFRGGSIERKQAYFEPQEWEDQEILEPEAYYQKVRATFARNLPRYFEAPEKIGMSLTGGLDTRMIMAWHQPPPGALPCYSFGGMFRDCQDVTMARRVAQACGQPHQVIPVANDFLAKFAHYAERTLFLSDGCTGVSHSPDLYVNERAAQIAPIRMTGNYGGEVLRRVRAFKPVRPAPALLNGDLTLYLRAAAESYARITQGHPLSFAVFRQAPWHHYGLLALEQTQLSLRSPYLDNDLVRTIFQAPQSALSNNDVSLRLISDGNTDLSKIRTDRGLTAVNGHATSLLTRHALEFTFKAEYAYDYGMPQWVAQVDHLFSWMHFERLFLGRHKFYHFRIWYRDTLAAYVQEMLLDPRTLSRPFLQRRSVEAVVKAHVKGSRNYTTEIHTLLNLELIHRLFLD
jgi:asparagine synthase (glutamine-hydrolysing)